MLAREGIHYWACIDPSGGRSDAMTCAVAHKEGARVVVDAVRGRKAPFDPSSVVAEYVDVLRRYGIREAQADRYAAEWVVSAFAEPGRDITITPSERSKSELYLEVEPMFAQGSIAIPADRTLLHELRCLERRTHRGAGFGGPSIGRQGRLGQCDGRRPRRGARNGRSGSVDSMRPRLSTRAGSNRGSQITDS